MNIDKYIDNAEYTGNGYCYKSDNAFDHNFDEICYIPEACIEELEEMQSEGEDKTDKELIEECTAYSRNSLREVILEWGKQYKEDYTLDEVIESEADVIVFQMCNWQCPLTFLEEIEWDELIHD